MGVMPNRRLDGNDPEAEALVAELLTEIPSDGEVEPAPLLPLPIIGIAVAAVLVAVASVFAFRRGAR
jgi:hypothetical protein